MNEEAWERMLEQAVNQMELTEIHALPSDMELKKKYRLSDDFYQRMEELIRQFEKKSRSRARWLKVAVFAACFVFVILWWNPEILVRAREAFFKWLDTHVEFHFGHEEEAGTIRRYSVGYLPEGFEVVFESTDINRGIIEMEDDDGNYIELVYTYAENETLLDNKEKEMHIFYDGDMPVYYLESSIGEDNIMVWQDEENEVSFSMFSVLGYEELEKVREGIYPVREQ